MERCCCAENEYSEALTELALADIGSGLVSISAGYSRTSESWLAAVMRFSLATMAKFLRSGESSLQRNWSSLRTSTGATTGSANGFVEPERPETGGDDWDGEP